MAVPDRLGRPLRDLRISVTDRCNFRCRYCLPREVFEKGHSFLPREELLSFEEIERLARCFVALGVRRIRLSGGEPLLRREVETLVERLTALDGVEDLSITTNGSLLPRKARTLREAGLRRMTVSLDALDEASFRAIADAPVPFEEILEGIRAALQAGFEPVKVNMVVKRGVNDHCIVPMARTFRGTGCIVRFIEYMDVGTANGWRLDEVVPAHEILRRVALEMPVEPVEPAYRGEVAERWRYVDGSGEIGVIGSVTQPFCCDCTRVRLSADGKLYTCLFGSSGVDLRAVLRGGGTDRELEDVILHVWGARSDRYSELRSSLDVGRPRVEMSYIGG